jgi:hypothetical protein
MASAVAVEGKTLRALDGIKSDGGVIQVMLVDQGSAVTNE